MAIIFDRLYALNHGPSKTSLICSTVMFDVSGTMTYTYPSATAHQPAKKIKAPQLSVDSSREGMLNLTA